MLIPGSTLDRLDRLPHGNAGVPCRFPSRISGWASSRPNSSNIVGLGGSTMSPATQGEPGAWRFPNGENLSFVTKEEPTFRYYDPVIGRYISRDPIGYKDGMNNYLYVGNNPINNFDPLGLIDWFRALKCIFSSDERGKLQDELNHDIVENPALVDQMHTQAQVAAVAPLIVAVAAPAIPVVAAATADAGTAVVATAGKVAAAVGSEVVAAAQATGTAANLLVNGQVAAAAVTAAPTAAKALALTAEVVYMEAGVPSPASGLGAVEGQVERVAAREVKAAVQAEKAAAGEIRAAAKVAAPEGTAYRYVGSKEAEIIENTGVVPNVDAAGQPKPVSLTPNEYSTTAEAENGLKIGSQNPAGATTSPTHRVTVDTTNVKMNYAGNSETGGGVEMQTAQPVPAVKVEHLEGGP